MPRLPRWWNRGGSGSAPKTARSRLPATAAAAVLCSASWKQLERFPTYIDRIAFLDANYAFDANLHADKFARWLTSDESHRLIVLAYDDREIMLDGKKVVGPTGGTFRATGRMREALGQQI